MLIDSHRLAFFKLAFKERFKAGANWEMPEKEKSWCEKCQHETTWITSVREKGIQTMCYAYTRLGCGIRRDIEEDTGGKKSQRRAYECEKEQARKHRANHKGVRTGKTFEEGIRKLK